MKIVTGNKNKQNEIRQFTKTKFVDIDLKEVIGNNVTIILHKAKDAKNIINEDVVVEDITMIVNNEFIPDIKWKQDNLKENDRVQLILTIGRTKNGKVEIHEKRLNGIIHLDKCSKYSFGFDNIFFVNNKECLGDFKQKNPLRQFYEDVLIYKRQPDYVFSLNSIPEYKGKYQND